MRLAQNSTLHRQHEEEIALGIALGPVSDKHWYTHNNYSYSSGCVLRLLDGSAMISLVSLDIPLNCRVPRFGAFPNYV